MIWGAADRLTLTDVCTCRNYFYSPPTNLYCPYHSYSDKPDFNGVGNLTLLLFSQLQCMYAYVAVTVV